MTIAVISSRFPRFGAETFLGPELEGLRAHFERVIVVPTRDSLFSRRTLADALRAVRANPRRVANVVRLLLLESKRPAIFIKNVLLLPKALSVARTVEREGVNHIHAYWLSAPATVALVASRLTGIPFSSSAHRWDIYEGNMLSRKAEEAAFIRTISDRGSRDLAALIGPRYAAKLACVRVGVRVPEKLIRGGAGALRLLCAANLIEQKGHHDLLDALAILRNRAIDFCCDVAGSGPLYRALERRIRELGLSDRVFMLGRIAHAQILERLHRGDYDAGVLASRNSGNGHMEGVPVALIEAMAAGIPCVATDSGSIPELLDSTVGRVVPTSDARSLAAALEELALPNLRLQLGRNARRRIEQQFNIDLTGPALAELIKQS